MYHQRLRRILIGVAYRPPNDLNFLSHFENIILRASSETNKSLILIGDFNCNVLAPNSHATKHLLSTTTDLQLTQLVTAPTRITDSSRTIIDLIFCSNRMITSSATVTPCSLSDHHIVSCNINIKPTRPPPHFLQTRPLHRCDTEALTQDLESAPWHVAELFDEIDDQVNFWENLYLSILDNYAPKKSIRVRAKSLPWIDGELRKLMRHRDWLHKKAIKDDSPTVWDMYRTVRNKVTKDLRLSKANYYHHLCSSNMHPTKLWKHLNSLLSRNNRSSVKSLVVKNTEHTDKTEIAEAMNSHFITAATLQSPPNIQNLDANPLASTPFSFAPVTEDEVSNIVVSLDPKKSSGPSEISTKCLQLTIPSMAASVARILNLSLQSGCVPSNWKAANVTPIHKKGDKQNPNNYRPISVIPVMGKILERVVYTRLMDHLNHNNILTPFQSGFRPNHSTEDVLLRTVEDWRREVDQGKAIAAVFIDFSKAFDSISHPLLLKKLNLLNIKGTVLSWFKDFLSNRRQRVVIEGHKSSWALVQQGVPQGSLLGPLLFSIYTNDMPSIVSNSSINMYADDTALYASDKNIIAAASRATKDLAAIQNWCKDNCLQINHKKNFAMFLARNKVELQNGRNQAHILLDGSALQTVSEVRYLGVLIDSTLSFKGHIDSITSKAYGALSTLRKVQTYLPLNTRKLLYRSLVLPHLEYCPSVWDPSSTELSSKIERVQNRAMRTILNRPPGTRSQPLRTELNWRSLYERRQLRRGTSTFKCLNKLSPPYLHNLFQRNPASRGRNKDKLFLIRPLTNWVKHSFSYKSAKLWNSLSRDTRQSDSILRFITNYWNSR